MTTEEWPPLAFYRYLLFGFVPCDVALGDGRVSGPLCGSPRALCQAGKEKETFYFAKKAEVFLSWLSCKRELEDIPQSCAGFPASIFLDGFMNMSLKICPTENKKRLLAAGGLVVLLAVCLFAFQGRWASELEVNTYDESLPVALSPAMDTGRLQIDGRKLRGGALFSWTLCRAVSLSHTVWRAACPGGRTWPLPPCCWSMVYDLLARARIPLARAYGGHRAVCCGVNNDQDHAGARCGAPGAFGGRGNLDHTLGERGALAGGNPQHMM